MPGDARGHTNTVARLPTALLAWADFSPEITYVTEDNKIKTDNRSVFIKVVNFKHDGMEQSLILILMWHHCIRENWVTRFL